MTPKIPILPFSVALFFFSIFLFQEALCQDGDVLCTPHLVKRNQRIPIVVTEFGEISAVEISDGVNGPYHLQFISLEPNSLLLPVLLHADMVFFVHTGSGTLTWVDEEEQSRVDVKRGDIVRLNPGSVFYLQSNLETEIEKLRIYAIFTNSEESSYDPIIGAYSSLRDVFFGFDPKILQSAFAVPEDVIETIRNATKPPLIVHAAPKNSSEEKTDRLWEFESRFLKAFMSSDEGSNGDPFNNKKKKKNRDTTYNIYEAEPDFENCNGWSVAVNKKDWRMLKRSNTGVFMVNLTKGSMMGPHWNPTASEISVVIHGEGMIRVVHSSPKCKNTRFRVEEGDVFAVPRFHPMAQMSFNNDTLVFMGFSASTSKRNVPQFLVGKESVLQVLDREILAVSFNVSNSTIDRLLGRQNESVILDCTSCAEEELMKWEAEIEKEEEKAREEERKREEEERKREEEEARKREEEEARKREEEEARKREEEEQRKREEEEEQRKREEEEARKREEEEERRREEEEERRREEEEQRKREEEEARKREEEEARQREEEEARQREEEAVRRREEEETRQREEEEARQREEEAARRREEAREREEEEARQREEEEARQKEEEAARRREEAREREEEEARQREEEEARQKEEEAARRREEAREREEEEARRQEEERERKAREQRAEPVVEAHQGAWKSF